MKNYILYTAPLVSYFKVGEALGWLFGCQSLREFLTKNKNQMAFPNYALVASTGYRLQLKVTVSRSTVASVSSISWRSVGGHISHMCGRMSKKKSS